MEQVKKGNLPRPIEGVEELLAKIDNWKIENWKGAIEQLTLNQYVNQIEPLIKDIMNSKTPGHVRIMTISRSKGLTVRAAIIAGAEDGVIPHPSGDQQEERRLLYVGMTRAREFLFITHCLRRIGPTARSGRANVAGTRLSCPFLNGGPVLESGGEQVLKQMGA